jgi:hypothetical protein
MKPDFPCPRILWRPSAGVTPRGGPRGAGQVAKFEPSAEGLALTRGAQLPVRAFARVLHRLTFSRR